MAGGAAALYRSTGEQHYLSDAIRFLRSPQSAADGTLGVVDSFASFAAADVCGALGAPALGNTDERSFACGRLREFGGIAVEQAHDNAFGMPGFFTWGTTAQNGASGALAGLAGCRRAASRRPAAVAAGARDYLLGRNPFGRSFVVGYGPRRPGASPPLGIGVRRCPAAGAPWSVARRRSARSAGRASRSTTRTTPASPATRTAAPTTSRPSRRLDYAASSILLAGDARGRLLSRSGRPG